MQCFQTVKHLRTQRTGMVQTPVRIDVVLSCHCCCCCFELADHHARNNTSSFTERFLIGWMHAAPKRRCTKMCRHCAANQTRQEMFVVVVFVVCFSHLLIVLVAGHANRTRAFIFLRFVAMRVSFSLLSSFSDCFVCLGMTESTDDAEPLSAFDSASWSCSCSS